MMKALVLVLQVASAYVLPAATPRAVRLPAAVRMDAVPASPDVSKFVTKSRDPATERYIMQQFMIRVKDPVESLEFYCNALGFNLVMYREFPQWGFVSCTQSKLHQSHSRAPVSLSCPENVTPRAMPLLCYTRVS